MLWAHTLTLIEQLEATRGAPFASIVRTRPDLYWEATSSSSLSSSAATWALLGRRIIVPARYEKYRRGCELRSGE